MEELETVVVLAVDCKYSRELHRSSGWLTRHLTLAVVFVWSSSFLVGYGYYQGEYVLNQ